MDIFTAWGKRFANLSAKLWEHDSKFLTHFIILYIYIYSVAYRIETIVKRPSRLHSNRQELTETVQIETNSIKPAITAGFIMIGKGRK